jgi:lipopolysaccharide transport protein LptA
MKPYCLILFAAVLGATLGAQTNSTPATPRPQTPTQINSDSVDFDLQTHIAIYRGNVRVDDPQMKLWCALLTATAPEAGGRIEKIVAETNVVMLLPDEKGFTNRATGDKLVYTYKVVEGVTNEVAVLTGNPKLEKPDMTVLGDVITWDRANNQLHVTNQRMIFRTDTQGGQTNPPPAANPKP